VLDINGVPIRGEYVVVDPPRRVVFTSGAAGSETNAPRSATVEILLHADGNGTTASPSPSPVPAATPAPDPWAER
jgi:uncharacterized protein YndB with AHSA1/START domain